MQERIYAWDPNNPVQLVPCAQDSFQIVFLEQQFPPMPHDHDVV